MSIHLAWLDESIITFSESCLPFDVVGRTWRPMDRRGGKSLSHALVPASVAYYRLEAP